MESVRGYENTNHSSIDIKAWGRALKDAAPTAMCGVAAVVFVVAHPIIGPLGSLANLFGAAYHSICSKYHWRQTCEKDAAGNSIPGTELNVMSPKSNKNYTNKYANFQPHDLSRLEHEMQRLDHLKASQASLRWARGLAKCTIPIIGPIWALYSELRPDGSISLGCGCRTWRANRDHWAHLTSEEMLGYHIAKLKQK